MTVSLLIVTPHPDFGEMIRQSLEETGTYRVHIASNGATAVSCLKSEDCALAFLDMGLGDASVSEIGRALRRINPDIVLVVVTEDETPPALDAIRPWVLLRKPFYLPDLLNMLGGKSKKGAAPQGDRMPASQPASSGEEPSWLNDVTKAVQHLTRLTLESSAQAALITRQKALWAYAGQLSQSAAQELALTVARYWDIKKESDLLRFVRLEATKAEHMLYATRLSANVILALVFDAETPFSTIHSQANHLAQSLSLSKPLPDFRPPRAAKEEDISLSEDDSLEIPPISEILTDVPSPEPAGEYEIRVPHLSVDGSPDTDEGRLAAHEAGAFSAETRPSTPVSRSSFSRETSPAIPVKDLLLTDQSADLDAQKIVWRTKEVEELEATVQSKVQRPATPKRKPAPGELDETRPHSVTEVAGRIVLEPVSPALYNLTYACLLVPRFSSHYLTSELADGLSEWLPELCIAFGWRLEFLAIRPEYLQWMVNVPPAASPGYLMRIVRQQTSERIFHEFPRLKKENPSGDFWAPWYLIMGGAQPHPPQLVRNYIKQTRQRQGISRPQR